MGDGGAVGDLLPLLAVREAWAVGLVVALAVLRPVGRLGWTVAGALIAGGVAGVAALPPPGGAGLAGGLWQAGPWLLLAVVLTVAAAGRPLRWEPRSGPSAATALLAGALVLHVGHAWHAGNSALAGVAARWGGGASLTPADLAPDTAGPLSWPLVWLVQSLPLVTPGRAAGAVGLAAAVAAVWGVGVVARRWGYTGTARSTAAAVAWIPPLLLAHGQAVTALLGTAALVWSWWALGEVWAGRHLPDRMALLSGGLLGAAVGVALWPAVLLPLWLGRTGGHRAAWFLVGLGSALVGALLALVPTGIGLVGVWQAGPAAAVEAGQAPAVVALGVGGAALVTGLLRVPLSPTRLSALSAALIALTVLWWPAAGAVTGSVAAVPFVLLSAVAPDRPGERWPPDAPLGADEHPVEVAS